MIKIELDPVVGILYGPSKHGKTSCVCYAFPEALFVAAAGALDPARSVVGFGPAYPSIQSCEDVVIVPQLIDEAAAAGIKVMVIDDLSVLAQATVSRLETGEWINPKTGKKGAVFSNWKLWGKISELFLAVRTAARRSRMHVFFTCHERISKNVSGTFVRGGPDLPGQLPEKFPAIADVVARTKYDPTRQGPWPYVMSCGPDPQWILGDREDLVGAASPLNLRELLIAAGHDLPRPKELHWMDAAVEMVSEVFTTEAYSPAIAQEAQQIVMDLQDCADSARYAACEPRLHSGPARALGRSQRDRSDRVPA